LLIKGVVDMRKYYLDNLKSFIILLLLPYHAAMSWNTWGEPNYIFFEGNKLLSSIVVLINPYFMPLLFLIAGITTNLALQKRTTTQYILERCKRLLLPFILGTVFLMPAMTYLAAIFNYGYKAEGLIQHYLIFFTKFTDLTGADGGFSVGQFWFLIYLFIISLLSISIIQVQKKIMPRLKSHIPLPGICFLGLPLPFLHELLSISGKSLAAYTYLFLIGYYIFSDEHTVDKIKKYKWTFLFIGMSAAILNTYLFIWSDTPYPFLNGLAKWIAEWFMLLALLGIGKEYLSSNGRIARYLSRRSFTFYTWHFIWLVLFQYLMSGIFRNHILLLYLLPLILSYLATFLCCEISIKIHLP
jgi:glucan biosynthesis protein C